MIEFPGLWDREAEQAVIACAMIDPAIADECLPLLQPVAFYHEGHRRIWEAIGRLRAERRTADLITLSTELQRAGVMDRDGEGAIDVAYLQAVGDSVPAASLGPQYAEQILEVATRRELMRAGMDAVAAAKDLDLPADELRDQIETRLRAAADAVGAAGEPRTLAQAAMDTGLAIVEAYENRGAWTDTISTGMPWVDRKIGGGLHRAQLTILAGRPSSGKSALAQAIGMDAAAAGACVVFASAEMDEETVARRALARKSDVDSAKFTGFPPMGDRDWPLFSSALDMLGNEGGSLYVDCQSQSVSEICAYTRRIHARRRVDLLLVDYLQYLRSPKGYRPSEIVTALGAMTKELRRLGKSLGCAVLCLSQLSRAEKGHEDDEPRLSDLRQSGEIEQDADVVLMLHGKIDPNSPPVCPVKLIVRKQRNGPRDFHTVLQVKWSTGRFWDEAQWRERGDADRTARGA